uniref:Uncharacterized protein n=1 Tax=Salix viminalis TaxID=40686 RepID=A0A6N2M522_SALVM
MVMVLPKAIRVYCGQVNRSLWNLSIPLTCKTEGLLSGACLKDDHPAMEHGLPDGNTNIISGREIAATEASKILEELSDQGLVLQHLGWIADVNPVLALQVLTSEKGVNQLSPDEVIAAIDPKKVCSCSIHDSCDAQFHTLYALSLAKSTVETFEVESTSQDPVDGRLEETKISDSGRNSIFQSPVRERLQIFLQSSDLYDPEEVLDLIEGSELWLEKFFGSPFSHCFLTLHRSMHGHCNTERKSHLFGDWCLRK